MSQRQAEVARHIGTVRQLDAVVNAMRGLAGARSQRSRHRLPAVRAYAETTLRAIAQARRLLPAADAGESLIPVGPPAVIVFGAEQGFAGAFPQQALDAARPDLAGARVFVVGSRTAALAQDEGLTVHWQCELPSSIDALTRTASRVLDAVIGFIAGPGGEVILHHPVWQGGRGARPVRFRLLPLDDSLTQSQHGHDGHGGTAMPPMVQLPVPVLIESLAEEYLFARLVEGAYETFAAENEARVAAMASAHSGIEDKLEALQAQERLTRQEEITDEVIELAAGARVAS
ncbi:MAG: F0F1 ATP synthase subunit gamma [Hydrogenophaga sp.]|nr:F0F1 ATP synthase subunit gamma [Hydrogenophaga sp.]